jgi:hypothetical protein
MSTEDEVRDALKSLSEAAWVFLGVPPGRSDFAFKLKALADALSEADRVFRPNGGKQ